MVDYQHMVLLAGGGSGGHIFPNAAVIERLRELDSERWHGRLIVSNRPLDTRIAGDLDLPFDAIDALPMSPRPWRWPSVFNAWSRSVKQITQVIQERRPLALIATGGFVSAPAIHAAARAGLPTALVNLDAIPGRANRLAARSAGRTYSVYRTWRLPDAEPIGMPLRRVAVSDAKATIARKSLGLLPQKQTLFVTGASQGARSINRMMIRLVQREDTKAELQRWQVLHLAGEHDLSELRDAYLRAGVTSRVEPFMQNMGEAWRAADIAISRAGAGSVGEAWANATPTIFFPYPYHRDQHQRANAAPLVDIDGAMMFDDLIDDTANARQIEPPLLAMMKDPTRRHNMASRLASHRPPDGALVIAEWLDRLASTPR